MTVIRCSRCGKCVSTPISEVEVIVRAWIECPECIQQQQCAYSKLRDAVRSYALHNPLDLKTPSELQAELLAIAGEVT